MTETSRTTPHPNTEGPPAASDTQPEEDPVLSVLVEALAAGMSYSEAGAAVGITARTVSRRLEDPGFERRVVQRKAKLAEEAAARIRSVAAARVTGVLKAQAVLQELLDDEDPKVRLAAARELHSTHAIVTAVALEERIARLEEDATRRLPQPDGFQL